MLCSSLFGLALLRLAELTMPIPRQDSCASTASLSAYAHNDYLNREPLHGAIALGYRGVEVDVFLVGGQFLIAHDRDRVDPRRTLEGLYLKPLRDLVARCGRVLSHGQPFLLKLISLDFGKMIHWSGKGQPPSDAKRTLERIIRIRNASPGRVARVYNVPRNAAIYRWLLAAGVDLIGTKDLTATRRLLTQAAL